MTAVEGFSITQIAIIKHALVDLYYHSSGVPGRTTSWRTIFGNIAAETDIRVPETESALRSKVDRIRQFATDTAKDKSGRPRGLSEDDLRCIVEYITNEDRVISYEVFARPDIETVSASAYARFLWDGGDLTPNLLTLSGNFAEIKTGKKSTLAIWFFEETIRPVSAVTYLEYSSSQFDPVIVSHGWAITAPNSQIIATLKNVRNSENTIYSSCLSDHRGEGIRNALLHNASAKVALDDRSRRSLSVYSSTELSQRPPIIDQLFSKAVAHEHANNLIFISKISEDTSILDTEHGILEGVRLIAASRGLFSTSDQIEEEKISDLYTLPVHAIEHDDIEAFESLVRAGKDVNAASGPNAFTALHHIAASANVAALKVLITRSDVDYTVCDRSGRTPGMLAAEMDLRTAALKSIGSDGNAIGGLEIPKFALLARYMNRRAFEQGKSLDAALASGREAPFAGLD